MTEGKKEGEGREGGKISTFILIALRDGHHGLLYNDMVTGNR